MKKDYASPFPKRFYTNVTTQKVMEQWNIQLDGRVLKTMGKHVLHVGNAALAEAIADEWRQIDTYIDPNHMPLTRLANIAIDRMPKERAAVMDDVLLYAETDLLCHRASEPELRAQQVEHWDKVLHKLEHYGIRMVVVTGVIPAPQPKASLQAIRDILGEADDWQAAALAMMVPLLGSVLLTIAVWKRVMRFDEAIYDCRLDEEYQHSRWGKDEEADALWQAKMRDIGACAEWLSLLDAK